MRLTQITPFVPCTSLARQVAFYRDVLGFSDGFDVVPDVDLSRLEKEGSFCSDVGDVDAVHAAMKPAGGRVPFDPPYDQREYHVADEDSALAFIGEAIRPS
jgi:catechol 2,3-dioxygenase-like lactoylglutathione lyase family enzyme